MVHCYGSDNGSRPGAGTIVKNLNPCPQAIGRKSLTETSGFTPGDKYPPRRQTFSNKSHISPNPSHTILLTEEQTFKHASHWDYFHSSHQNGRACIHLISFPWSIDSSSASRTILNSNEDSGHLCIIIDFNVVPDFNGVFHLYWGLYCWRHWTH